MTATCRSRFDLVESRRWSPTISVFFPGQINSRWPPPPPTPCRTKLIRKWRSLGEPLFRVDCTPPNGNGLLPPFRIPVPPSALSLFRGSHTHTQRRERERREEPRNCAPRNRFIRRSIENTPFSSSALLSSIEESLVRSREIKRRGRKGEDRGEGFWKLVFECGIRGLFWI